MKTKACCIGRLFSGAYFVLILSGFIAAASPAFSAAFKVIDTEGRRIPISQKPRRVISLVPAVTEMICMIGAGDALKGITYHSTYPPECSTKTIVGGFFSPSMKAIEDIDPDMVFVSDIHRGMVERLKREKRIIVNLELATIEDIYRNMEILGKIFRKEKGAADVTLQIESALETIERKVAGIPRDKRKRIIRLMGGDRVMTPGDDSFQNDFIRLAGGVPPELGKKGDVVPITMEEWVTFNPQVIYGCGEDRKTAARLMERPGWNEVEAITEGNIFFFPCDLTCRLSTRTGDFVSWLSARAYPDEFSKRENQIYRDRVIKTREIDIDLDYVDRAFISHSHIRDFQNKTLVFDFKEPVRVVSTLEGNQGGIRSVGNHYSPPPCWILNHNLTPSELKRQVCTVLGRETSASSFLFTGADMDNLSIKRMNYKDMKVFAVSTAGVKSNAVRMSADEGRYYEPGTINIIILTNMQLTPRAMTRAIISATEAKTAALMDTDIRSSYTPRVNRATGTGTDNIIVVEGKGVKIDNSGGHTRMGELIAGAVYESVREAIFRQNGIAGKRNVFQRLNDRGISTFGLVSDNGCECGIDKSDLAKAFEKILLEPRYASLIEYSMSISDDYERGLISDISAFEKLCKDAAGEICGTPLYEFIDLVELERLPPVMEMSLNYVLNGLYCRMRSSYLGNKERK